MRTLVPKTIFLVLLLNLPLRADQLKISLKGGICGDCCVMKLFVPGVRNAINAQKGNTEITLDYDSAKTSPDEIVKALKKVGKDVTILSSSPEPDNQKTNWVKVHSEK